MIRFKPQVLRPTIFAAVPFAIAAFLITGCTQYLGEIEEGQVTLQDVAVREVLAVFRRRLRMALTRRLLRRLQTLLRPPEKPEEKAEAETIAAGWDLYARRWSQRKFQALPGFQVQHLGDEWTAVPGACGHPNYGLSPDTLANFGAYITERLLDPYLPSFSTEGLEIGPGGGRITELLVHRTKVLHLAEPSGAMVRYLRQRLASAENVLYYQTDGMTLPPLSQASLDYVIAFDVFVHFEPRLVYWYLRQIAPLLRPGATGIIHYADITTPTGWQEFETGLERNLRRRSFDAFGVMCPQLMAKFLDILGMDVVSLDVGMIPRDAVTVFRKPKSVD